MSDWRQQEKPHLKPVETGRSFAPAYETELTDFDVNPAEWAHVCSARFGDGRSCGFNSETKWTGNSYRYDIFDKPNPHGSGDLVALRWSNGSGDGWLVCERKDRTQETNILDTIAAVPCEATRWDLCHFLYQTAHKTALAASRATAARYDRAFLEKRIKKEKIRGMPAFRVTIIS